MESILKTELLENGFTSFSLKEFDEKLYNKFQVIFPKNELNKKSFRHLKHSIRQDVMNDYNKDFLANKKFDELEINLFLVGFVNENIL